MIDLPEIQRHFIDVKLMTQKILDGQQLTPEERAELIMFIADLREQHQPRIKKNMGIALSRSKQINRSTELQNLLNSFTQDLEEFGQLADALASNSELVDKQDILRKAEKDFQKSFVLWDKIVDKQEMLLQLRINQDRQTQALFISLIIVTLAVVIYLFTGFYRSVMLTVYKLELASRQMVEGHSNEEIILDNRDELGEVVKSFNNIAAALVKSKDELSLLNEKLNSDNFRMKNELDLTREIQQKILPRTHELAAITQLDVAGFMHPASEIGGDYYDVLYQKDGRVKIGIGDVK